jgi:hypothetical protein
MTFVPVETLEQVIKVALPESGKVEKVDNGKVSSEVTPVESSR